MMQQQPEDGISNWNSDTVDSDTVVRMLGENMDVDDYDLNRDINSVPIKLFNTESDSDEVQQPNDTGQGGVHDDLSDLLMCSDVLESGGEDGGAVQHGNDVRSDGIKSAKVVVMPQQLEHTQPTSITSKITTLPSVSSGRNAIGGKTTNITAGTTGLVPSPSNVVIAHQAVGTATQLNEFITQIRPPTISGQTVQLTQSQIVKAPTGVSPTIVPKVTVANIVSVEKKPTPIAPAPIIIPPGTVGTQPGKLIFTAEQLNAALSNTTKSNSTSNAGGSSTSATQAAKLILTPEQLTAKLTTASGQKIILTSSSTPIAGTLGTVSNSTAPIVLLSPLKGVNSTGTVQAVRTPGLKTLAPASVKIVTASNMVQSKDVKPQPGIQIIKVVGSTATTTTGKTTTLRTIAPSPNTKSGNTTVTTASVVSALGDVLASGQKVTVVPTSAAKVVTGSSTSTTSTPTFLQTPTGQIIMIPANLLQGSQIIQTKTSQNIVPQTVKIQLPSTPSTTSERKTTQFVPIAPSPVSNKDTIKPLAILDRTANGHFIPTITHIKKELHSTSSLVSSTPPFPPILPSSTSEESSNRSKKPCNCTKSQCLKLYCDCFANGEFCSNCNCNNCYNNLDHEEDRQRAVRICLERNPYAFHPKIGKGKISGDVTERRHTKGCNCRRSGCLKNYCACYEAKILCTELCKCCGCKNYEDSYERKSLQLMNLADAAEYRSAQQSVASKLLWGNDYQPKLPVCVSSSDRLPCSFITQEVIDATCQCLMTTAEEGEKSGKSYTEIESSLVAEFGRCLKQIIECASRAKS